MRSIDKMILVTPNPALASVCWVCIVNAYFKETQIELHCERIDHIPKLLKVVLWTVTNLFKVSQHIDLFWINNMAFPIMVLDRLLINRKAIPIMLFRCLFSNSKSVLSRYPISKGLDMYLNSFIQDIVEYSLLLYISFVNFHLFEHFFHALSELVSLL